MFHVLLLVDEEAVEIEACLDAFDYAPCLKSGTPESMAWPALRRTITNLSIC